MVLPPLSLLRLRENGPCARQGAVVEAFAAGTGLLYSQTLGKLPHAAVTAPGF